MKNLKKIKKFIQKQTNARISDLKSLPKTLNSETGHITCHNMFSKEKREENSNYESCVELLQL